MFSPAVTLSIYAVTTSMLRILQNHLLVQANEHSDRTKRQSLVESNLVQNEVSARPAQGSPGAPCFNLPLRRLSDMHWDVSGQPTTTSHGRNCGTSGNSSSEAYKQALSSSSTACLLLPRITC
jgi:hypothetical protein